MKIAVFAVAALLSGCSIEGVYSTPNGLSNVRPEPAPLERLPGELSALIGQNLSVAVNRLGYPTGQREMLGDTIYVWETHQQVQVPAVSSSAVTGNVGSTPYYGLNTTIASAPGEFACTIQLAINSDKTIKSWQLEGNNGGCASYANALSR